MIDRLTLKQRRAVASLMEVYDSPTTVRPMFRQRFARDSANPLTVRRIYQKFVETRSVANNYRGNAGRPRSGRCELNIIVVQQSLIQSPSKCVCTGFTCYG